MLARTPVVGLVVLCLAAMLSFATRADDGEVPTLRSQKLLYFVYLGSVLIDGEFLPVSSLPVNRPFKAIRFAVRGLPQEHELAKFAQHVMWLRLEELGIAGQIGVLIEPGPPNIDPPSLPAGVTECNTIWASFVFRTASGKDSAALSAILFGTQDSPANAGDPSECLDRGVAPPQVLASWPRTILIQDDDSDTILRAARRQIVELIDAEIVSKVVNISPAARATIESWSESAN